MQIIQRIRKNATGEIRECTEEDDNICGLKYLWMEGNYRCDCNRSLLFSRFANEPEDFDIDCSEGLYSAEFANADTGEIICSDF